MVAHLRTLYWSHLQAYEQCPQKYLWGYGWGDIDLGRGPGKGRPRPDDDSKHHAVMGIVIQAVLEDFYNLELWKHPQDLQKRLVKMAKEKLATTLTRFYIDWNEISFEEMEETVVSGVLGYLPTMKAHKLLGTYARSEVNLYGLAKSWIPVGGRVDFVIRRDDTGITLLDGKNSKTKLKYTDPDQLRWYALCFYLSYHKLPDRLGFVWFRYPYDEESGETGIDWVDFHKRDLNALVERAKKVRRGQEAEKFPAKPAYKVCRFCDFESVCEARQEHRAANAEKRKNRKKSLPVFEEAEGAEVKQFGFGNE